MSKRLSETRARSSSKRTNNNKGSRHSPSGQVMLQKCRVDVLRLTQFFFRICIQGLRRVVFDLQEHHRVYILDISQQFVTLRKHRLKVAVAVSRAMTAPQVSHITKSYLPFFSRRLSRYTYLLFNRTRFKI